MQGIAAEAPLAPTSFLNVDSSLTGRVWRERLAGAGQAQALAVAQRHGVPDLLATVLVGRGVTLDAVPEYLAPTIRSLLPEPYRLTDMEAAAERIAASGSRFSETTMSTAPRRRRF
jgi:single-stranded-DNA-specific exonuclease